jgi:mycothiol synthase
MDYDLARRSLLARRRYRMLGSGGWMRVMRFGKRPLPVAPIEEPYVMATTSPLSALDDASQMAVLLNAAFGRTRHTAAEYVRFMDASPSFSHELNLVAVAPDGSFAAHVGVTYDEHNRHGIFEPVCTHPAHQRHGLARALMLEGMHRLRELGALTAYVETGDMGPANALYRAVGFSEEYRGHTWQREL